MQDLSTLQQALTTVVTTPRTAILLLLLLAAAVNDVRSFRIPNALTVPGMLLGLLIGAVDSPSAWSGLLDSMAGLAVGLLCLIPLHVLRVMGAGDVKLMAAAGAFLGFPAILPAIFFVVFTGGILAVGYILVHRAVARTARNIGAIVRSLTVAAWTRTAPAAPASMSIGRLPYGVCIFAGTAIFVVVRELYV